MTVEESCSVCTEVAAWSRWGLAVMPRDQGDDEESLEVAQSRYRNKGLGKTRRPKVGCAMTATAVGY